MPWRVDEGVLLRETSSRTSEFFAPVEGRGRRYIYFGSVGADQWFAAPQWTALVLVPACRTCMRVSEMVNHDASLVGTSCGTDPPLVPCAAYGSPHAGERRALKSRSV
jgi:hypothetical protein